MLGSGQEPDAEALAGSLLSGTRLSFEDQGQSESGLLKASRRQRDRFRMEGQAATAALPLLKGWLLEQAPGSGSVP